MSYQDDDVLGPRQHLVDFPIPQETLEEFYLVLALDAPLYTCLVKDENGDSKLFIERSGEIGDSDIFRVFWRQSDIKDYIAAVKKEAGPDIKKVMAWQTTKKLLIELLTTSPDERDFKSNIDIICTAKIKGEFRKIETFWSTSNTKRI